MTPRKHTEQSAQLCPIRSVAFIPAREKGDPISSCQRYVSALLHVEIMDTLIIKHEQTAAQAVAMINQAGAIIGSRFRTASMGDGLTGVWRIE